MMGDRHHKTTECGQLERNSTCILISCEIHTLAYGKGLVTYWTQCRLQKWSIWVMEKK